MRRACWPSAPAARHGTPGPSPSHGRPRRPAGRRSSACGEGGCRQPGRALVMVRGGEVTCFGPNARSQRGIERQTAMPEPDPLEFARLAEELQAAPTPAATADEIVDYVRSQLDANHAGITLIRASGRLETVAGTDPLVERADRLQYELDLASTSLGSMDSPTARPSASTHPTVRYPTRSSVQSTHEPDRYPHQATEQRGTTRTRVIVGPSAQRRSETPARTM